MTLAQIGYGSKILVKNFRQEKEKKNRTQTNKEKEKEKEREREREKKRDTTQQDNKKLFRVAIHNSYKQRRQEVRR